MVRRDDPEAAPPAFGHASVWGPEEEGTRYERGRPDYPPEIVDLLRDRLHLGAGSRVVDLAAGTGKLTRRLVATGAAVTAVEPMGGMRDQLRLAVPAVAVAAGRAEALPLAAGSVDAVTVAQAFHWFALPDASRELRRVLRPSGRLALVNNRRDDTAPWVKSLWEVLRRYERLAPRPSSARDWRQRLEQTGDFESVEHYELPMQQRFASLEDFDARFASISFVILLPEEDRRSLLRDLREVVAGVDPLVVPLRTVIEVATRRG